MIVKVVSFLHLYIARVKHSYQNLCNFDVWWTA